MDITKMVNEEYEFDAGIIVSSTDCYGNIVFANKLFYKISGYDKEEVIGSKHNILRHPDVPNEVYNDIWTTITNGYEWSGVLKNLRKDGRYFWVYSKIIPIIKENIITGYASVRRPALKSEIKDAILYYDRVKSICNKPLFFTETSSLHSVHGL